MKTTIWGLWCAPVDKWVENTDGMPLTYPYECLAAAALHNSGREDWTVRAMGEAPAASPTALLHPVPGDVVVFNLDERFRELRAEERAGALATLHMALGEGVRAIVLPAGVSLDPGCLGGDGAAAAEVARLRAYIVCMHDWFRWAPGDPKTWRWGGPDDRNWSHCHDTCGAYSQGSGRSVPVFGEEEATRRYYESAPGPARKEQRL